MNTKWHALLAAKRSGIIQPVTDAGGEMTEKQFRDRTSDKRMYPIETLRRIVKEISTDEQDEFISIMGRRLYESQYVCFSRREVQELVRACLQEMTHEKV